MTIKQIWMALEAGYMVNWSHKGYKIIPERVFGTEDTVKYQKQHFSYHKGMVLSIRHYGTYFGGLIQEQDLAECYICYNPKDNQCNY